MELRDLLELLARAKHNYAEADRVAKECKQELADLKQLVADALVDTGLKSAKTDDLTVSMVQKPAFKVTDERALINYIDDEPTLDLRSYLRLDLRSVDTLAREALHKNGEVIPGGEIVTSEYLSIKENK